MDLVRIFMCCLVTSTDSLKFELAIAHSHRLHECAAIVKWHLRARAWLRGVVS